MVKYKKRIKDGVRMKKITYLFLALCVSLTMVACSNSSEDSSSSSEVSESSEIASGTMVEAGRDVSVSVLRVTGEGVNIRSGASTDSEILTQASQNTYFTILSEGDTWNKIEYDGQEAYIHADYSTIEKYSAEEVADLVGYSLDEDTDEDTDESADVEVSTEAG